MSFVIRRSLVTCRVTWVPGDRLAYSMTGSSTDPSWLAEFQQLLIDTEDLQDFLTEVTVRVGRAMPGVSCGLTVRGDGIQQTVAGSDDYARGIDAIQYAHQEGPCLAASDTGEIHTIGDLNEEARWPRFTPVAGARGLGSVLSLPVGVGETIGALNLYARVPRFFDAGRREQAVAFAGTVTGAITLAVRMAREQRLNRDLHRTLQTRSVINQAIGVLMAQHRCNAEQAFAMLSRASQQRNVKVRVIAARIVTSVSGGPPTDAPFGPQA
ncbi:GAF and ANTAR domain-containing protein [Actinoplanes sp. NEAU-A12]|uniref:GAF and ANTAR domain-containing protein n=1 Tax=Actinoplanes sandaracinus TaxID=3045177 RepID=A0ABT6WZG5_9ACTN|nr:GAF and ANTAR domain-containing protein [Actinoplanes sandaracinus]MDI6105114.1 GAF and ANTAR domain-containing protein [Actinoplanes sandaracinus]